MNGVLFGNKHSWTDWNLILKYKPDISFPLVKTNYIDLSGSDGQIDLTESLTGEVHYQNRTGSLTFTKVGDRNSWNNIKTIIADYLHGQRMQMILDEDRSYFYVGRFSLNEWKSDKKTGDLVIDYNLEPYKYNLFSSVEPWEWDTFNFETDIIRNYSGIEINGTETITLIGSRKTVVPTITVVTTDELGFNVQGEYGLSGEVSVFNLPDGTYKDPNFIIRQGEHEYQFYPDDNNNVGTLTIDFRGGRL